MPRPFSPRRPQQVSGYEWQRRRARVIVRDGRLCQLRLPGCTIVATTADHIVSPIEGGTDEESNLRAACAHCNDERGKQQANAKRPAARRRREPEAHPGLVR